MMHNAYVFLTGPALWFVFVFCTGGLIARLVYLWQISREKDRIVYNHVKWSWGFRSLVHWLIPWASDAMRRQPIFTALVFVFHLSLIGIPLFLGAHNVLWDESFGVRLPSIPDRLADILTLVCIGSGLFLMFRRWFRKEVRILSSAWDYTLLILTLLPFVTGFIAYHQWGAYDVMLMLHIVTGEILLLLIPITKLSHVVLFFFTRIFIGFEMGGRRGARAW
jgi:nitrate reductase gamma subunit